MVAARRLPRLSLVAACACVAAIGIAALGSDGWVSQGFDQENGPRADVWGGSIKTVVANKPASEADWLAAQKALQPAVAPGATRIDLGPLDVIDVRPLPPEVDLGTSLGRADVGAGRSKLLVTARDVASGRTVRIIIEAEPSAALNATRPGL
jgi:hypothetical protein